MTKEINEYTQALAEKCGLILTEVNNEKEMQWIGTGEQLGEFAKLRDQMERELNGDFDEELDGSHDPAVLRGREIIDSLLTPENVPF